MSQLRVGLDSNQHVTYQIDSKFNGIYINLDPEVEQWIEVPNTTDIRGLSIVGINFGYSKSSDLFCANNPSLSNVITLVSGSPTSGQFMNPSVRGFKPGEMLHLLSHVQCEVQIEWLYESSSIYNRS